MPIAHFSSLEHVDVLDLAFSERSGGQRTVRLLVDSGFTGESAFVLPASLKDIALAQVSASEVTGAIQGTHSRSFVLCHVSALTFHYAAFAIITDVGSLSLPPGVDGIVGLQFLRQFQRWGAEQTSDGKWRFFLETKSRGNGAL
jgi:hypothetical protein